MLIEKRIKFKINVITFNKALKGEAPTYIKAMLEYHQSELSKKEIYFKRKMLNTVTIGDHVNCVVATKYWYELTNDIREIHL